MRSIHPFKLLIVSILIVFSAEISFAQQIKPFEYLDVFQLEYAGDPQISPNGDYIIYRLTGFDIMKDRSKGNLWMLSTDGKIHHKIDKGNTIEITADLTIGKSFFKDTYKSFVVYNQPEDSIHVTNIDGPLKHLENDWSSFLASPSVRIFCKCPL